MKLWKGVAKQVILVSFPPRFYPTHQRFDLGFLLFGRTETPLVSPQLIAVIWIIIYINCCNGIGILSIVQQQALLQKSRSGSIEILQVQEAHH